MFWEFPVPSVRLHHPGAIRVLRILPLARPHSKRKGHRRMSAITDASSEVKFLTPKDSMNQLALSNSQVRPLFHYMGTGILTKTSRLRAWISCVALTFALLTQTVAAAQYVVTPVMSGLDNPRGLAFGPDGGSVCGRSRPRRHDSDQHRGRGSIAVLWYHERTQPTLGRSASARADRFAVARNLQRGNSQRPDMTSSSTARARHSA